MSFKEISPYELEGNFIDRIGNGWMLVTAAKGCAASGDPCGTTYNTMTASWGGTGVLWGRPVAFVFIRPERHTFSFTEESDLMTLSFFGEEYRKALAFCGAKSGRDVDKAAECGLTPVFEETDDGTAAYFDEADTVLVTRKLYARPLDRESFTDPSCLGFYENAGLHTVYVCEIEKALVNYAGAL